MRKRFNIKVILVTDRANLENKHQDRKAVYWNTSTLCPEKMEPLVF